MSMGPMSIHGRSIDSDIGGFVDCYNAFNLYPSYLDPLTSVTPYIPHMTLMHSNVMNSGDNNLNSLMQSAIQQSRGGGINIRRFAHALNNRMRRLYADNRPMLQAGLKRGAQLLRDTDAGQNVEKSVKRHLSGIVDGQTVDRAINHFLQ